MDIITRLQKIDPHKLIELCRMHLTFTLDLNNEEFSTLVDPVNGKKKPKNYFSRFVKDKPVAEMPLNQQTISHIYQIVEFLGRETNIGLEGLFRKCGSLARQNELKTLLRIGENIDFSTGHYTVHDCACVLKSFLSELSEPLLTEAHYSAHCQITDMMKDSLSPSQKREVFEKQLKATKLLLLLLPDDNYCLLRYLLLLLYQIQNSQERNKMSSENLATLFAPHVICPKKMPPQMLRANFPRMTKCIAFLIDNALLLFDPPEELVQDVSVYLEEMSFEGLIHPPRENSPSPVRTRVAFCKHVTTEDTASDYTAKALSDLQYYIENLPSSARKRKLVKKFQKDGNDEISNRKHARSRSVGDAIKRHLLKNTAKKREDTDCRHSAYDLALPLSRSDESIHAKCQSADALLEERESNKFTDIKKNFLRASRKKVKKIVSG